MEVEISDLERKKSAKVKALVDTGASLTVLPEKLAAELGIHATSEEKVTTGAGEIKAVEAKIESVDKKSDIRIESLRKEMLAKFESVDVKLESTYAKVESLRNEMISRFEAVDSRFDSLEAKLPVMEKMAEFEVRLADCVAF